jgi:hypothetical protein
LSFLWSFSEFAACGMGLPSKPGQQHHRREPAVRAAMRRPRIERRGKTGDALLRLASDATAESSREHEVAGVDRRAVHEGNDVVRGAAGVVDLPMVASMLVKVAPGP